MAGPRSKTGGTSGTDTISGSRGGVTPSGYGNTDTMVTPPPANASVFIDYTSGTVTKPLKFAIEKLPQNFDKESKGMNLLN